eukprot:403352913
MQGPVSSSQQPDPPQNNQKSSVINDQFGFQQQQMNNQQQLHQHLQSQQLKNLSQYQQQNQQNLLNQTTKSSGSPQQQSSKIPQLAVLKVYKRGQIFFKLGCFMVMTMPPSIYYYKKNQKDLYARGIIKDMKRIHESGRTMHDIPKYTNTIEVGKRH